MSSISQTPSLLTIPPELRVRILVLTASDFCPLSVENAQLLLALPRYYRVEQIYNLNRAQFTDGDRGAYARICRLYHINSIISMEMVQVERIWLMHRLLWPPLNLAQFAAYAAAPTPVNGILTLSLFDESFIANPPQPWDDTVQSLANEDDSTMRNCEEYMRAWRQTIFLLPANGARTLRIEAVEVVDVGVKLLRGDDFLENQGWVRESVIARFEILLMMKLGLGMGRVRVMRPVWRQVGMGVPTFPS